MLVTTFKDDIQQFKMCCFCLKKNWKGVKDLIVCIGSKEDPEIYQFIVEQIFSPDWKVEIKSSIHNFNVGTTEQQANTVFHSITSGVDDIIVWDCKDFLLRPADFSIFKKNQKYRVTYYLPEKLVDMGYDINGVVEQPIDNIQAISNLRPWIWNVEQLRGYWDQLNNKFGNYQTWDSHYPAGCEIYGYYVYTLKNPNSKIEYLDHNETPFLIAGGWTFQTYEGMCEQAKLFDSNPLTIVWKHSRKLSNPQCLEVTKSMLLKYGIDQQFVNQVYN